MNSLRDLGNFGILKVYARTITDRLRDHAREVQFIRECSREGALHNHAVLDSLVRAADNTPHDGMLIRKGKARALLRFDDVRPCIPQCAVGINIVLTWESNHAGENRATRVGD